jgi:hypothetical protein
VVRDVHDCPLPIAEDRSRKIYGVILNKQDLCMPGLRVSKTPRTEDELHDYLGSRLHFSEPIHDTSVHHQKHTATRPQAQDLWQETFVQRAKSFLLHH